MSYVTEEFRQKSRSVTCPVCGGDAVEISDITKISDDEELWDTRLMCKDCDLDQGATYSVTYPRPQHFDLAHDIEHA